MKFKAIPENELRNRVAALARYLEDFDLPDELGGEAPDCDVVDGAIRYIKHKREEVHQVVDWLGEKQKKIDELRRDKATPASAFEAAGRAVQDGLQSASGGEKALAAALYAAAVGVKGISDTLRRVTGQVEVDALREEVAELREQASRRFREKR